MIRKWLLIGPTFTIGSATAVLIMLGLGSPVSRWVMFAWPATVIVWSSIVLGQERTLRRNRVTIELQARVIHNQTVQMLTGDNGSRE